MIGLSLSLCVSDILCGEIAEQDVEKIVAATCFDGQKQFEKVCANYERNYWNRDGAGTAIAQRLYDAGRIDQPRLRDEKIYDIYPSIWVENETELNVRERVEAW